MPNLPHFLKALGAETDARRRREEIEERARVARVAAARQRNMRIIGQKNAALGAAPRDWIALECLGNARDFAKSDTRKRFVLWEGNVNARVEIDEAENLRTEHPWLRALFLPSQTTCRFPFNTGDTNPTHSLSWDSVHPTVALTGGRFWSLPRWSTASRSSAALIPERIEALEATTWPDPPADVRQEVATAGEDRVYLNLQEWQDLEDAPPQGSTRFFQDVGRPGLAAQPAGVLVRGSRYRLYSIKTGVDYVGGRFEGGTDGKHRLESNSTMAMRRSDAIRAMPEPEPSLGLQLELLTVTATGGNLPPGLGVGQGVLGQYNRDGFQVRDLSCLDANYDYLPGQAIPFGGQAFGAPATVPQECDFWRQNFAVPLGRAKARLFLNYGLIHTSANAQNFLLGFDATGLRQFVIRDLGDTSWHDDYIRRYLRNVPEGKRVYKEFSAEAASPIKHVLRETTSGAYPAPHLVRLAAHIALTHGFADEFAWDATTQYRFATGIIDGFAAYIHEAVGIDLSYPRGVAANVWTRNDLQTLGRDGTYPHFAGPAYLAATRGLQALPLATLLARAAWVRRHAGTAVPPGSVREFVGAEEALVCCALQKTLDEANPGSAAWQTFRDKLKTAIKGNWPRVVV